mmetsp:Transcript_32363/g.38142  ORF Transcript_32363/g.38142 Transcript_32363/m.38142 type:complete len:219 (+) Transcript_32363:54-710(+)
MHNTLTRSAQSEVALVFKIVVSTREACGVCNICSLLLSILFFGLLLCFVAKALLLLFFKSEPFLFLSSHELLLLESLTLSLILLSLSQKGSCGSRLSQVPLFLSPLSILAPLLLLFFGLSLSLFLLLLSSVPGVLSCSESSRCLSCVSFALTLFILLSLESLSFLKFSLLLLLQLSSLFLLTLSLGKESCSGCGLSSSVISLFLLVFFHRSGGLGMGR